MWPMLCVTCVDTTNSSQLKEREFGQNRWRETEPGQLCGSFQSTGLYLCEAHHRPSNASYTRLTACAWQMPLMPPRGEWQRCPLCLFEHLGTGAGLWALSLWSQRQPHCRGVFSSLFAETEQGLCCRTGTAMGKNAYKNTMHKAIRSVLFLKVQELLCHLWKRQ